MQKKRIRIYLKTRSFSGEFDTDWIRIDEIDSEDLLLNCSNISQKINRNRYDLNSFEYSGITIKLLNHRGYFNNEDTSNSLFYGKLTRIYSKIRIDFDIEAENFKTIFSGVITRINRDGEGTISFTVEDLNYILSIFPIKTLNFSGSKSSSEVITGIFENAMVKNFIISYENNLESYNLKNVETNTDSFLETLKKICVNQNGYFYFEGEKIFISKKSQNSGIVSKNYEISLESSQDSEVLSVDKFDDDGYENMILRFESEDDQGNQIYSASSDQILLDKYLGEINIGAYTVNIDLEEVDNSERQNILNGLLSYWGKPRKSARLKILWNSEIDLFKQINFEITSGRVTNRDRYGHSKYGEAVMGETLGEQFFFGKNDNFIIESKDIDLKTGVLSLGLKEL